MMACQRSCTPVDLGLAGHSVDRSRKVELRPLVTRRVLLAVKGVEGCSWCQIKTPDSAAEPGAFTGIGPVLGPPRPARRHWARFARPWSTVRSRSSHYPQHPQRPLKYGKSVDGREYEGTRTLRERSAYVGWLFLRNHLRVSRAAKGGALCIMSFSGSSPSSRTSGQDVAL
jgi:hypothetical protein